MPLYRQDLEACTCGAPGCEANASGGHELTLLPRCHLASATWVRYRDGLLTITCAECERELATIAVASRASARKARGDRHGRASRPPMEPPG